MKTVRIPKRKLIFAALAIVALVGVACVIADVERDPGNEAANPAAEVASSSTADVALSDAEVEAAVIAAGHALGEIMRLDHAEGREAWEARIAPLCTENGLAFWSGPLFAGQVWPAVEERGYTTQAVEVVETRVIDGGSTADSATIEVTLNLTYTQGESDEPVQEESTNQVVMVKSPDGLFPASQDGQWLTDGPPPIARGSGK